MQRLLIFLIKAYRYLISPLIGPHCRFHPSCSAYGLQAVQRFGAARGAWLAARRVLNCHPLHVGGYDPVPDSAGLVGEEQPGIGGRSCP